ncbi:MAG: ribosome maturation factor RimP [Nocardioidaceae bacterium]
MTGHQPREALLEVLQKPLEQAGLDLEAVEISAAGRRSLVRVFVDQDGGITLDDIADATRLVSDVLDQTNLLGEAPYTLEVTSPGVDRPLTLARHWKRNADRLVNVTPHNGAPFTGRVLQAGEEAATLDVEGSSREITYAEVAKARVEIEFNRRTGAEAPSEKE